MNSHDKVYGLPLPCTIYRNTGGFRNTGKLGLQVDQI